MRTMPAAKAKLNFGALLDAAQREPVSITKKGRPVAVLLSKEEYERLEAIEDAVWAVRAENSIREGRFLGHEESMKLLQSFLDA